MRLISITYLLLGAIFSLVPWQAAAQTAAVNEAKTGNSPASIEVEELRKKADAGDASAQYALGHAYEKGQGVPQNFEQAAAWYRKAAELGDSKAQECLGVYYWLGQGVEKDKKIAVDWYRKAARQGNASAMFNLGAAYYNGEGTNVDDTLAQAWFLLSSEAGDASGRDAAARSRSEHGDSGYHDACFAIGEMYEKGEGLPANRDQAIAWYKKAADGPHHGGAAMRLALIYLKDQNYSEARPWCEIAAKDMVAGGAFCMGYLYQRGITVRQDSKTAFTWYSQAVRGGHVPAIKAVAKMYEQGEGTKVNLGGATYLQLVLANRSDSEAGTEARRLRGLMNDRDWKATQKLLLERGFDPKKVDAFLQGGSAPTATKP